MSKYQKTERPEKMTERNVRMFSIIAQADENGTVDIGNLIFIPFDTLLNEMRKKYGVKNISSNGKTITLIHDFRINMREGVVYRKEISTEEIEDDFV